MFIHHKIIPNFPHKSVGTVDQMALDLLCKTAAELVRVLMKASAGALHVAVIEYRISEICTCPKGKCKIFPFMAKLLLKNCYIFFHL